jgi:hypothetical protein
LLDSDEERGAEFLDEERGEFEEEFEEGEFSDDEYPDIEVPISYISNTKSAIS